MFKEGMGRNQKCVDQVANAKTIPISELSILVHPKQTWMFPVNDITIKVPKCTKIWDKSEQFLRICDFTQYFKASFDFMC